MSINKHQPKSPLEVVLDREEQSIENALAHGDFVDRPNFANTKETLEESARKYSKNCNTLQFQK